MDASTLCARVVTVIENGNYDAAAALVFLNQGVQEIASGGDRMGDVEKLAPLPDLLTSDTITLLAGESSVSMPDEYHRGLVMVVDSSGGIIEKFDSHIKFLRQFPLMDETGDPEYCSLKGSTLYCQPSPSSNATLTVHFHRLPVDMSLSPGTGEPDGIPAHLHERLLVSYACKEIYAEIEDGKDGKQPNTKKYTARYRAALADLARYIGPEDGEAQNVDVSSEDYIW